MKSKDTIRSIFRSRWVSGISDSISTKSIAICLLWCPIMLHPSYNYFTTERICAPLCQQVPYCTLSRAKLYPRKWTRDFDPWPRSADTHLTHRGSQRLCRLLPAHAPWVQRNARKEPKSTGEEIASFPVLCLPVGLIGSVP